MSIAPHTGIVDFGTFTAPTASTDGIQGEVPQPLAGQEGYVLTGTGWASAGSVGLVGYQGTWNALTNTPTLTSSVGVQGYYYVVNIAGTTNLNGITDWQVGDWAIFNGSVWQKVDNTDSYDPANVAITGGTINNTTIGATTPANGTFTDASVTTATGQSSFNENDTITGWIYSGNSFSVGGQETSPTGLFIGSNGTKMYVCGSSGDDVNEYTLSTAWDITTASFVTVFSVVAQDSAPQDVFFKPDGLTMFVIGSTNDTVFQYTLTVAWDVSTASYASKSFSVASQETVPLGLWFKSDGLVMYVVGSGFDTVFQYTLGTAWDVSTASYGGIFYSVAAQDAGPVQVNLSADGTKMWVLGSTGDDIWEYALGTAWNVSTATPVNNFYIGFQETTSQGLFIDSTASNRVYVMGSGTDAVYQYYTTANSLKLDTQKLYVDGALSINENFVVGQNAYVDNALNVQGAVTAGNLTVGTTSVSGTLSATSTITLGGSTTGTTGIGTTATTGTFFAGGTAQTGIMTLGQSTVSQTTNIQAGATASGSTKTINFGTGGLSGSTTTIAIGSAVSGSLGSIAIQSPTVNIGQTATQFAVTNTASAVNYVQVTGAATGFQPVISMQGSDANIGPAFSAKGTGRFDFYTQGISSRQFSIANTSSAVNYVQVTGAATGGRPVISAQGSDTNLGLNIQTKGTGAFFFATGGSGSAQFVVSNTSSSVNYVQVTGATTGNAVVISAQGTDTNIPAVVQPKGTGALQAQQTDSTATGGNARGANAVDWQTSRNNAAYVASGAFSVIGGGYANTASNSYSGVFSGLGNTANGIVAVTAGGQSNVSTGSYSGIVGGLGNTSFGQYSFAGGGQNNTSNGLYSVIGGGFTNAGTANSAVTTQSGTMNATTAVTLSGSNASIKVGQYITGTSIASDTYVAAISGTSLTLSKVASGSSTSTLSFFTPHGVVVGGGNNQATGSYSFIGGGGDAGTAANRNVASGDRSVVVGGVKNTASGEASFVGGGGSYAGGFVYANTASANASAIVGGIGNTASGLGAFVGAGYSNVANGTHSIIVGGVAGTTRSIVANHVFPACSNPVSGAFGASQASLLVLGRETTNATPTVLTCDQSAASTVNQVILPNNSAYYFRGEVVSGVTGGGNTKGWFIEGVIKRGANAASTALVGTPTVTSTYADAGASTWTIAVTADTTNGGLAVTFTGQASTTIRTVAQIRTTEMTY